MKPRIKVQIKKLCMLDIQYTCNPDSELYFYIQSFIQHVTMVLWVFKVLDIY